MISIKKYYFDGIHNQGNSFILYEARLKIFGFSIPYSSYMLSENGEFVEKSVLLRSEIGQGNSSFQNEKLKIFGKWQQIYEGFSEVLLDYAIGKLHWDCRVPKARFQVSINEKSFEGLGYSELLMMNFSPWKLPISTLKWGRFLSENHTIVWIEWQGTHPLKKVYWNGNLVENVEISDKGIVFYDKNAQLTFENPISIKNEKLLSIADKYPFLKLFFSKKFLQSREMKFKSKSVFTIDNQSESGFSLYETVLWEK